MAKSEEQDRIKKVAVADLRTGMYIHDMDSKWLSHNFLRSSFAIKNDKVLNKVRKSGLKHVYIDVTRGDDIAEAPSQAQVEETTNQQFEEIVHEAEPPLKTASYEDELENARNIVSEANSITKKLLGDIRLGKRVEVESFEPISEQIVDSVMRNKDALVSLTRMKNKDDYTFMHSVSVSGLMVTFARAEGLEDDTVREIALGGLLHDIGKMLVPDEILNKPGQLTDDEFDIMKSHVIHSRELLSEIPGMTSNMIDVVLQHHERADGSGYPLNLKGDAISKVGSMSAIVDVYDALTSVRVYKSAWEPTQTLKKMLEWSDSHFNKDLLRDFIRCLGIYPAGTMIEMKSGRIGTVLEQHETELTKPKVKLFYHKKKGYYPAEIIDLSREEHDVILKSISPREYGVDLSPVN